MPPIEEQLKLLKSQISELTERFQFHSHSGMDSREIDYRRLLNKPISNEKILDGALGAGGVSIGANGSLKAGQTAYDTGTGFWLEYNSATPRFSLGNSSGNKLTWNGTTLSITGTLTATVGTIGGFTIGATTISATNLTLTSGAANTANIAVGSGANTAGINSSNGASDIAFWAGATFANRATAPFRVNAAGEITHTTNTLLGNYTISTGGNIRSGQTAYNTGTGYFLEYNGGTPRLSIGDGTAVNSVLWDGSILTVNGSPITNQDIYGDGSDGDVTISGDTSLSSDMFYDDLTINTGVTLNPNGYRIFVKGTLTISGTGTIARTAANGGNGTGFSGAWTTATGGAGGTAGAALAAGSIPGGKAGANGGQGGDVVFSTGEAGDAGTAGNDAAKSIGATNGAAGVAGGQGGSANAGGGAAGGAGGGAGAQTGTVYNKIHNVLAAYRLYDDTGTAYLTSSPGSGGSGGGGSGAHDNDPGPEAGAGGGGGASGSSGGIVLVFARIVTGTGTIKSLGGAGGNGGNGENAQVSGSAKAGGGGGGGAGSGGAGGVAILIYGTLSGVTLSATGGAAGTAGTGGTGSNGGGSGSSGTTGNAGSAGITISLQV